MVHYANIVMRKVLFNIVTVKSVLQYTKKSTKRSIYLLYIKLSCSVYFEP